MWGFFVQLVGLPGGYPWYDCTSLFDWMNKLTYQKKKEYTEILVCNCGKSKRERCNHLYHGEVQLALPAKIEREKNSSNVLHYQIKGKMILVISYNEAKLWDHL